MVNLDRLVNILGGYGTRLIGSAAARSTELRSVAVHDPADSGPVTGDVFLAVGVRSAADAVRLAARARAAAVLVRAEAEPGPDVGEAARAQGLVILLVDPAVSWSQIAGIVYGLVQEGRETEAGRGPSDLSALADTIAAAVGGAVTIEDQMSRVVAYSGPQQGTDRARLDTILGRRVPDPVRELFERTGVFTHLATSQEPLFVPPSPAHGLDGRMVAAVRVGRELLGSLWVTCDRPLSAPRARVLTEGARTVALHLLRARVSADLERQVESELVIQVLEGSPDSAAALSRLGLPPRRFRVIALQAHTAHERHSAILLAFERATTGFGWSRPGRSTLFGNTVYTVLPCGEEPEEACAWLRETVRGLPGHVVVTAGVGGPADPADLPASKQEADESLALHASLPEGAPPVVYDDSWDAILLRRLRTAADSGRRPGRGPVAELARHDAAHATRYVLTLRAWLGAHGDQAEAARLLGVHPNTVRYRMRRMSGLADLGLDDPERRLALTIALAVEDAPAPTA